LSKNEEKGVFISLWDGLSSLRLTIALLIILAVVSIFGTFIPQNASPAEYLKVYKLSTYKILKILGFLDMYHAGWFVFLLALLSLNLIACSLKRFRVTWRFFSPPRVPLEEAPWQTFPWRKKFFHKGLPAERIAHYREALSRTFSQPQTLDEPPAYYLFAEKGKLSRLGAYFIHLSILIILAGALIGSIFGFRGNVNIEEGETATQVVLRSRGMVQPLGFRVRLEKFNVSFYPSGAPKEFKSTVTILEGDRPILTEPILVNHPLTYKGISFYQSSYGLAGVQKAVLAVKDRNSQKEVNLSVQMGTQIAIPGSSYTLLLARFTPDFQRMGPAFQLFLFAPNHPPENFWVFLEHPEFEEKRPGPYQIAIREIEPRYYSGLQVTKDPGVEMVWVGCFLMMVGFYLVFFLSHRRIWARVTERERQTLVELAGSSHRDQVGFEKEFEKIGQIFQEKTGGIREESAESEKQL